MTIDRIGSYANAQFMFAYIMKAENALDISNRQVATGKVADNYAGYRDKTAIMEAARSASARADANAAAASQALARLDVQDAQLSQLSELANEIRTTITKASADRDGTSLMSQLEAYFDQIVGVMNSKDANGYIYAGDNNQTAPVVVNSLADLAALPTVADAFANGPIKTEVKIGDSQNVEVGLLASDLATELFDVLRQVAQFDAGVDGPFSGTTTPAQQTFLESDDPHGNDRAAQRECSGCCERHPLSDRQTGDGAVGSLVGRLQGVRCEHRRRRHGRGACTAQPEPGCAAGRVSGDVHAQPALVAELSADRLREPGPGVALTGRLP